ncbi:MAG: hypothetical protein Q8879_01535 [Candidatus Phytoplasma australasiaticum]|nr:hypothetical protein [Candidatus Phytoplasma australasiaticum]
MEGKKRKGIDADKVLIMQTEQELTDALLNEERYWREKSRVKWLKHGDQNTRFFHSKFLDKSRKNNLLKLIDNQGTSHTDAVGIAHTAISFFEDLFTTTHPPSTASALNNIPCKVDEDTN